MARAHGVPTRSSALSARVPDAGLSPWRHHGSLPRGHHRPKEREGSAVGAERGYTATTAVWDAADRRDTALLRFVGGPLPYGLEPDRAASTELVAHPVEQGIIERAVPVETLFAPAALGWNR